MAYGDVSVANQHATEYVRVQGIVFPPDEVTSVPIETYKLASNRIQGHPSLYVLADIGTLADQAAAAEDLVDNELTYTPVNFTAADAKLQTIIGGIDTAIGSKVDGDGAIDAIDAAVLAATFTSTALSGANDPTTLLDALNKIDAALAAHSL